MLKMHEELVVGSLAGMSGVVVGAPLDLIKVLQQQQGGGSGVGRNGNNSSVSISGTLRGLLEHPGSGVVTLFRGLLPPLFGAALYTGSSFAVFTPTLRFMASPSAVKNGNEHQEHLAVFTAGCVAGAVSTVVTCPTEVLKIGLQTTGRSPSQQGELRKLLREISTVNLDRISLPPSNGKNTVEPTSITATKTKRKELFTYNFTAMRRGLFHGFGAQFIRDTPTTGVYFLVYYAMKSGLQNLNLFDRTGIELLAGGFAGTLCWLCAAPFDVLKTKIQMEARLPNSRRRYNQGTISAMQRIIQEDGLSGLTRGLQPLLLRAFPVNAATFLVYEELSRMIIHP